MAKQRAVAYIRVSTKSDAQSHSFEYQLEYWRNTITQNTECEYMGVYADKGISGRALAKRPQLLKLLTDARQHKFDVASPTQGNINSMLFIRSRYRDSGEIPRNFSKR